VGHYFRVIDLELIKKRLLPLASVPLVLAEPKSLAD